MPYKVNKGKRTVWRASKMVDGQRRQKDCRTKKEALAWEKALEEQMRTPQTKTTDMDLVDFADRYLSYVERRQHPRTYSAKRKLCFDILEAWGKIPISQISSSMVLEYLEYRAEKVNEKTYNRDLKNLKAMFSWGIQMLGFPYNPAGGITNLPVDTKKSYVPPREDVLRVLSAASPPDKVMLICLLNTAARRGEVFGLKWDDVDFAHGKITLTTRKTKGGSPRRDTLDMSDELHQTLLCWRNSPYNSFPKNPFVFVCHHLGKNYGKPFTTRRTFMNGLCKRAGVKPFGFHALRHHVASFLADHHGARTLEIKYLLRHKRMSTTEGYIQRPGRSLKPTVDLLRTDENLLPVLLPKEKEGQR